MPEQFLHGVEVVEIDTGPRPIRTVKSSVIGLVGTAPDADPTAFPLDTPVLVAGSLAALASLDTTGNFAGTLPAALDGIFDQAGAMVVVVRVAEGADAIATITGPARRRIRICPECAMMFVDTSRPGKRRWCSSATGCGNRAKVRRHRAKRLQPE